MFYIAKDDCTFAAHDSEGEHDNKRTNTLEYAREFPSWRAAADFIQNFGPDWRIVEY